MMIHFQNTSTALSTMVGSIRFKLYTEVAKSYFILLKIILDVLVILDCFRKCLEINQLIEIFFCVKQITVFCVVL